jgi:hypothetical protein
MILRDLLGVAKLRMRLLVGDAEQLGHKVRWVFPTELAAPARYLSGGELVVSGLVWRTKPEDSEDFVAAIATAGAVGLAAGTAHFGLIPDDLVGACERHRLPLFEVPVDVSFTAVTEHVLTSVAAERISRLAASLGRQRQLLSAVAEGRALDELARGISEATGVTCRVLTPLGTHVVSGPHPLADADLARVITTFLTADRLPAVVGGRGLPAYSVFAVGPALGLRLTSWFIVADGIWPGWEPDVTETVGELAAIAALDRARHAEGLRVARQVADDVLALVAAGKGGGTEATARLRQSGLDPRQPMTVVVARFTGGPGLTAAAAQMLDDLSAQLVAPVVVTTMGTHAIGLLPGSGDPTNAAIRAAVSRLKPGLGTMRVALGVSEADHAGMLSGALDSARHALQMAELDQIPVSVVNGDEVTSYLRLLATVPDDVCRTFATRVLGSVLDYDKAHDTQLRETLETFLAHSGSWSRTAVAMHLHVNTVRYRVARVAELTGRDLARLEDRVDLLLALHSC